MYATAEDYARLAFELMLVLFAIAAAYSESQDLWDAKEEKGTYLAYFDGFWNYFDMVSISLSFVCIILWINFVTRYILTFKPELRYDVYENLDTAANLLNLNNNGDDMQKMSNMVATITNAASLVNVYMSMSGFNLLLFLLRTLKLMDFQPRLGVITHTLALAASDLIHFFVIFAYIFVGYALVGHLLFGYQAASFATLIDAHQSLFNSLLGDIAWNEDLQGMVGLEYWLGVCYFWSFQTFVVLILLNFLLAIICDAFSEIKEEAADTSTVVEDLRPLVAEAFRSMAATVRKVGYVDENTMRKQLKLWSSIISGGDGEEVKEDLDNEFEQVEKKRMIVVNEDIKLDSDELKTVLRRTLKEVVSMQDKDGAKQAFKVSTEGKLDRVTDMLMDQLGANEEIEQEAEEEAEEEAEDGDAKLLEAMHGLTQNLERMQKTGSERHFELLVRQKRLAEMHDTLLSTLDKN